VVEPAFGVDRIDGKDFDAAGLDMVFDGVDQVEALVFEIICSSGREHQQSGAVVAIGDDGHFGREIITIPRVKGSLHKLSSHIVTVNNSTKISLLPTHLR